MDQEAGLINDSQAPPTDGSLIARNPANGAELARVPATPLEAVEAIVARASAAQKSWASLPWKERRVVLHRWCSILARDAQGWALAIRDEIGKPEVEAMAEVIASLDAVRWTVKNAGRTLADRKLGTDLASTLLYPTPRVRWAPLGVIGIIGTWNYPVLLNAPTMAQALAAGNAVVWKPSELAIGLGLRLQNSILEAGIPEGLVTAIYGGAEVGRVLVGSKIDKGVFTGGIEAGRSVLGELGRRGVPAIAELSGFDPAIILPGSPIESTVRALTWGSFVGAGQTCVAVKRVYVVGEPRSWAEALADRARSLRVGDPGIEAVDVGPMISVAARDRFHSRIEAARLAGAEVLAGGSPVQGAGSFYPPTVLMARGEAPELALAGCFGPVVVVRGVEDVEAAVQAVNAGAFGLSASVWGRDLRLARSVASRLEVGMVSVNDAVTPSGHASSPFGGRKASGFGRTRGPFGLLEMVQPQVIHVRNPGGFRPHLFPYTAWMLKIFSGYRRIFHPRG